MVQEERQRVITAEAWFDMRCPWCYLSRQRLTRAIARFEAGNDDTRVGVVHRSFELAPEMPARLDGGEVDYLERFENVPRDRGIRSVAAIQQLADAEGVPLAFDGLVPVNTRPGHRVFQFAQARGLGEAMLEALFRAYFSEHRDLSDPEQFGALATGVGLDAAEVSAAATDDSWDETIDREWRRAQMLGAEGVPYFLLNAKYEVRGAVSEDEFVGLLEAVREREWER